MRQWAAFQLTATGSMTWQAIWEWTTDWYQEHGKITQSCCGAINPRGAEQEESYDPNTPDVKIPRKVMKGGLFLCAPNYCRRYRPAARMAQPIDTSTCHLGFRCIVRAEDEGGVRDESNHFGNLWHLPKKIIFKTRSIYEQRRQQTPFPSTDAEHGAHHVHRL